MPTTDSGSPGASAPVEGLDKAMGGGGGGGRKMQFSGRCFNYRVNGDAVGNSGANQSWG